MLYALGGIWIIFLACSIVKLEILTRREDQEYFARLGYQDKLEIEERDEVADVEFREVDDFSDTRKKLKKLGEKNEDIRFFLKQCVADMDETKELKESLKELEEVSFNPATFENIEGTLEIVQRDVVQNAKDIITICIANKVGKQIQLDNDSKIAIKQELADNKRRIDKFRMILTEGAKFATQKDNEHSDLDLDSWQEVFKQLNTPSPKSSAD